MDIRFALMMGTDIPVPECQLILHQPSLLEIAQLGESDFYAAIQTICLHKSMFEQGETLLSNISNFQIFMTIMSESQTADKKNAVQSLFLMILPGKKISFTPNSLIITGGNEPIMIDENNFEFLQEALRLIFCLRTGPMDQSNFNPVNERARQIAEKIMKGRAKIAAEKGNAGSILAQYTSILSIGLQLSIKAFDKYTLFQLYDAIERYGLHLDWDLDVRTRLAGGKPDKQPENWMKQIH